MDKQTARRLMAPGTKTACPRLPPPHSASAAIWLALLVRCVPALASTPEGIRCADGAIGVPACWCTGVSVLGNMTSSTVQVNMCGVPSATNALAGPSPYASLPHRANASVSFATASSAIDGAAAASSVRCFWGGFVCSGDVRALLVAPCVPWCNTSLPHSNSCGPVGSTNTTRCCSGPCRPPRSWSAGGPASSPMWTSPRPTTRRGSSRGLLLTTRPSVLRTRRCTTPAREMQRFQAGLGTLTT